METGEPTARPRERPMVLRVATAIATTAAGIACFGALLSWGYTDTPNVTVGGQIAQSVLAGGALTAALVAPEAYERRGLGASIALLVAAAALAAAWLPVLLIVWE